jgi:diphthamide synthase subunit DPH2
MTEHPELDSIQAERIRLMAATCNEEQRRENISAMRDALEEMKAVLEALHTSYARTPSLYAATVVLCAFGAAESFARAAALFIVSSDPKVVETFDTTFESLMSSIRHLQPNATQPLTESVLFNLPPASPMIQ